MRKHKGGRPPLWGTPHPSRTFLPAVFGGGGLAEPGHAEKHKWGRPPLWGTPHSSRTFLPAVFGGGGLAEPGHSE